MCPGGASPPEACVPKDSCCLLAQLPWAWWSADGRKGAAGCPTAAWAVLGEGVSKSLAGQLTAYSASSRLHAASFETEVVK